MDYGVVCVYFKKTRRGKKTRYKNNLRLRFRLLTLERVEKFESHLMHNQIKTEESKSRKTEKSNANAAG